VPPAMTFPQDLHLLESVSVPTSSYCFAWFLAEDLKIRTRTPFSVLAGGLCGRWRGWGETTGKYLADVFCVGVSIAWKLFMRLSRSRRVEGKGSVISWMCRLHKGRCRIRWLFFLLLNVRQSLKRVWLSVRSKSSLGFHDYFILLSASGARYSIFEIVDSGFCDAVVAFYLVSRCA
jgi:hypothetical protein